MTNDELRIRVAELVGFMPHVGHEGERWISPDGKRSVTRSYGLPDYTSDLNAMHEVESLLTADQSWKYERKLREQLGTAAGMGSGVVSEWNWHATAEQRARAFVATMT